VPPASHSELRSLLQPQDQECEHGQDAECAGQ